ncbi:MAG: hypothetical protein KF819_10660 [Labilithrix sp.]|nr:hypothetical protein [Labilithrix sp.]
MRGAELLAWLAALPPDDRDRAVEEHLHLADRAHASSAPGEHLVGYHASGVAPIVRAVLEIPIVAEDVFVDLGSGLGKVVRLVELLTGARARGVEVQGALVDHARDAAARDGSDVAFTHADARDAALDDGTVFFMYTPFTGHALADVTERLLAVAERRAIVVCCLGFDLDRHAPSLVRRDFDAFWLSVYDSVVADVPPRPRTARSILAGAAADAVALGRALSR